MQGPPARENLIKLVTVVITLLAMVLEWYARKCGFLLTSDSLQYLSAARSFQASGTFLSPDGSHYSYWPPLFPVVLSWVGDPLQALAIINVVCKVVIGWLVYRLGQSYLTSTATRLAFVVVVMWGLHLLLISVFVWSELVFVTLALALLYLSTKPETPARDGALVALGFLLCLQRNAGLFWIAGLCAASLLEGAVGFRDDLKNTKHVLAREGRPKQTAFWTRTWVLLLGTRKDGYWEIAFPNLWRTALYFLLTTSGLWVWNAYNTWFIQSDFVFYQQPFLHALVGNSRIAGSSLAAAFVPASLHGFWGILFALLVAGGSVLVWQYRTDPIVRPLCLAIVYCLGFVVLGPLDPYEADRYFCIVPMLLALPLLRGWEWVCQRYAVAPRIAALVLAVALLYPVTRTLRNAHRWQERSCQEARNPGTVVQ
jgi:hypothetical protein